MHGHGACDASHGSLPYPDTPIELIDLGDVARLVDALALVTGGSAAEPEPAPPLPAPLLLLDDRASYEETAQVLGDLISRHGVSWPGRYSHSPVEVADLRDIEALVRLIAAIAMQ